MHTKVIQIENPSGPQPSDSDIKESVLNALKWQSMIPEDKMSITVEDGVVTLKGEADSQFQRDDAGAVVQRVNDVRRVINLITLKSVLNSQS